MNDPESIKPEEIKDQKVLKEQELRKDALDEIGEEVEPPINWPLFILFSYLYILQGIISGIIATMPYVYKNLPSISTMAIFSSTNMPFTLKFILAPFIEKFTNVDYGKRKFWVIVSMILGGATLMLSSFYTDQRYADFFAVLCILAQVCMAFLDIVAHSLMVKELDSPNHASIILCYGQTFGALLGGLIILKFTSTEFSESVGLSHPITTPQVLIFILAVLLLIPIVIIHFKFHEKVLQSERKSDKFSFCEIISYYSTFLKPASRYFRVCIFLLFYQQGLNFFVSLYDYKLVEKGFSRDLSNDLGNLISIPVIITTFYMGAWTKAIGGKTNSFMFIFLGTIALNTYLLIFFPLNPWVVGLNSLSSNILDAWRFFIVAVIVNEFPPHALTGMYITVIASCSNFGRLTTIHTEIINKFGWEFCSAIGLGIQLVVTIFLTPIYGWVKAGNMHVPKQIQEDNPLSNHHRDIELVEQKVEEEDEAHKNSNQIEYS